MCGLSTYRWCGAYSKKGAHNSNIEQWATPFPPKNYN